MFSDYGQECIVSISPWDSLKIHVLSFTCGFWVILKRLAQWAWNPNGFFSLQRREAPPPCLVDSSLGRHSYVKLKVNSNILITSRFSFYQHRGKKCEPQMPVIRYLFLNMNKLVTLVNSVDLCS